MSFYDLPKVRKQAKPPEALKSMTKETAYRKFCETIQLKKDLQKQLKKLDRDSMKYFLTYTRKD